MTDLIGFTDPVTEQRARSMVLATEVATSLYGYKHTSAKWEKFMESFFDPVLEYMSAAGSKVGDTMLAREAALRSALTLFAARGVQPPEVAELFAMAKTISYAVMPELPGIEASEDQRLVSRFLPQALREAGRP